MNDATYHEKRKQKYENELLFACQDSEHVKYKVRYCVVAV